MPSTPGSIQRGHEYDRQLAKSKAGKRKLNAAEKAQLEKAKREADARERGEKV